MSLKSLKEYMVRVESGDQLNEMGQQQLDIKQQPGAFSITDPQTHTNITTTDPATVQAAKTGKLQIGKVLETEDEDVLADMDHEEQRNARRETLKYYKEHDPSEFPTHRDRMAMKGHEFDDDELSEEEMMEVAPPGMEDTVLALKKKFPGQEGKAFAIAWSQYNKKHGKKQTNESIEMMPKEALYESTLDEVLMSHPYEHKQCQEGWGMDQTLYEALMDHYYKEGRIPRAVWHGPEQELRDWVEECYGKDTGMLLDESDLDEGFWGKVLGGVAGAALGVPPVLGAVVGSHVGDEAGDAASKMFVDENEFSQDAMELNPDWQEKPSFGSRVKGALKTGANKALSTLGHGTDDELLSQLEIDSGGKRPNMYKKDESMYESNSGKVKAKPYSSAEMERLVSIDDETDGYEDDEIDTPDGLEFDRFGDDEENMNEAGYSAKKAAAGKDIGKPGKNFAKIANKAGKEYGSKAAGERVAGAILKNLRKESVDVQMEAWDKQFESILNEGQSVSISLGNEQAPDTVSVTATDADAHELVKLLQNAGMGGVVGAAQGIAKATDGDNTMMSQNTDGEEGGEVAVVDFDDAQGDLSGPSGDDKGDEALSFLKKMLGQKVSMTPSSEKPEGEEVVYGNDEGEEDSDKEETEEGNKFTGNLAKARAAGKKTADLDGDGDEEKVKEGGFDREKFGSDGAGNGGGAGGGDITKESGDGKKPDDDNDGVPNWADKKPGEDDNAEDDEKEKVDEGEWDGTAMQDMAAATAQDGNNTNATDTEEETALAEGHGCTCNECGTPMAEDDQECMECGYMSESKSEKLDEWANGVNRKNNIGLTDDEEQFQADMNFMMNIISGGLNNKKVDDTTLPHTRVRAEPQGGDEVNFGDLKKLAGLR